MEATSLSVRADDVTDRIRRRVLGLEHDDGRVIWQRGPQSVLLVGELINARLLRGWLVVSIELITEQTDRVQLELVYFLGTDRDGDGDGAAVTINASTPEATALAEIWGTDLQRVVWDAVLDVIQGALARTAIERPEEPLTVRGFMVDPEALRIDVLVGAF